jgi:hypothetical protein
MALDGHIRDFCLPNALLTLAEYAVGRQDEDLRKRCLAAVEEGRRELALSPLRQEFERKLAEVLAGGKDRHF